MNSGRNAFNPLNFLTFSTKWIATNEVRLSCLSALFLSLPVHLQDQNAGVQSLSCY